MPAKKTLKTSVKIVKSKAKSKSLLLISILVASAVVGFSFANNLFMASGLIVPHCVTKCARSCENQSLDCMLAAKDDDSKNICKRKQKLCEASCNESE